MSDIISVVFSTLSVKSAVYFKETFCGSWGMKTEKGPYAQFHVISRGQCLLTSSALTNLVTLQSGDMVIFPHGSTHQIKADHHAVCRRGQEVVGEIINGSKPFSEGDEKATLICGHYEIDQELCHPFFKSLPDCIIIRSDEYGQKQHVGSLLEILIDELDNKNAGYELITLKLAEVLLISVIRHYYSRKELPPNFIKDKIVYEALNFIHRNLQENWTAEQLAKSVGVSRTLLFSRFRSAVGESPIKYLTNWKMMIAKQLLKETDLNVAEICDRIGYLSKSSFIRSFKKRFQLSPLQFRKSQSF